MTTTGLHHINPFNSKAALIAFIDNHFNECAIFSDEEHRLVVKIPTGDIKPETCNNPAVQLTMCPGMQNAIELASQVAGSKSTVLIQGETGTGKELIANMIHYHSSRSSEPMVKVNCAALPPNLVESELFGHEKGSFTGAIEKRIGKFEIADGSTLFLDEIGDMPFNLQAKLLRAIQEREIERIGGKSTIKVDVRIIAATNKDLEAEVKTGRFRSDLFYRLNVFPILLPPLRERAEDIPVLVPYFIGRYTKLCNKQILRISAAAIQELCAYDWPGNVRELEHLIEKAVLQSSGPLLKNISLPGKTNSFLLNNYIKTIDENERDHIIAVIQKCKGKISGRGGAAEKLGVPPSTLNSKIRKLGITKTQLQE